MERLGSGCWTVGVSPGGEGLWRSSPARSIRISDWLVSLVPVQEKERIENVWEYLKANSFTKYGLMRQIHYIKIHVYTWYTSGR